MFLQWPNKNTMFFSDRPSAYTTGSIWLFNVSFKTLSSVAYENLGAESLWDASGSALIFSAESNNAGGQLAFRNTTGTQKALSFSTLPSKCIFDLYDDIKYAIHPLIYCAVPQRPKLPSLSPAFRTNMIRMYISRMMIFIALIPAPARSTRFFRIQQRIKTSTPRT